MARRPLLLRSAMAALLALACGAAFAVTVRDDAGHHVTLARPAQRIISMAPHATELLFAAGAGSQVVGVMNYSDYPAAARSLPLVGSNQRIDLERVLALKPDLLVVWKSGNTARQLEQLASLGLPMFYSEPQQLDDVASSLLRLGQLTGTEATAQAAAAAYRQKIGALAARYGQRPPVTVFYQIWDQPLYTLNGEHIASAVLRLCGGRNVFADLKVVAPSVSTEAVLQQDPEVLLGGLRRDGELGIALWKAYPGMLAVRRGNLFLLDGEALTRPAPRIADVAASACEALELARRRRAAP